MRPFKSVANALRFYFNQADRYQGASSVNLSPKIQGLDSAGRGSDIMALYLSVDLCLTVLKGEEIQNVARIFNRPALSPDDRERRIYHRAMVKLGKEMRRRGVVG